MLLSEALTGPEPDAPRMLAAAAPEVLLEILRPEVVLAQWARDLPPRLCGELARFCARPPFEAAAEGAPEEVVSRLVAALPCPAPLDLLNDIARLAAAFAGLAGQDRLRLGLSLTDQQDCPRFHADSVRMRLLCTYRGAGTEWLPLPGGAAAAASLDTPPAPCRAPSGDVLLFKGERARAGAGCIHRSPPQPAGAPPRLVLRLDEAGLFPCP